MIIDTEVLIWYLRGNKRAKNIVEDAVPFSISVVTYMEIIQGMRNKEEFRIFQKQMLKWNTKIIQIDQEISSRAIFLCTGIGIKLFNDAGRCAYSWNSRSK